MMNILRGDVPNVNTLAILTGWNPMGQNADSRQNNAANKKLKDSIKSAHFYSFPVSQPIVGKYGSIENSFLIPHIDRNTTIALASRFKQEAVIFGTKQKDKHNQDYIDFEWVQTSLSPDEAEGMDSVPPETYKTLDRRKVVVTGQSAQSREDFYSATPFPQGGKDGKDKKGRKVNQRKFWIPFFDEDHADAEYSFGKRSINFPSAQSVQMPSPSALAPTGTTDESTDPGIEVDRDVSFVLAELPDTPKVRQLVSEIKKHNESLNREGTSEKSKWVHRAQMRDAVRELSLIKR